MSIVTQETVRGWVSCMDARCVGYQQRERDVTRETVAFSYRDNGALNSDPTPWDTIERSSVRVIQLDEACEHCGGPVLFADQPRPVYPQVSGQDDLMLLNLNQQGRINDLRVEGIERDKAFAEMRAQMAEMQAELQRRRGGRPAKAGEEPAA